MSGGDGGGQGGGSGGNDSAGLSMRMMENYLLLKAAAEQQNQGGFDAMCMHLTSVHRNLVSMIAAVEGMEVSREDERRAAAAAADPRGPEAAAAAAAADAALRALQAVSAASVGAAGMAALASLQRADAPAAPPPVIGQHQHAAGGGSAPKAPKAEPSGGGGQKRRKQQQQQQQQPAAPVPPSDAWMGDVGQSAARLLERLGLGQHQLALEAAGVDLAALRLMGERHLLAIGLPMGAVVKLRAALGGSGAGPGEG